MPRPRFNPDLMAELRGRVIAHNEAGLPRVRLEELKKQYRNGHKGRDPHAAALARVDRYLGELAKSDQPRTPDGRFAPTGGGQAAHYADVASRQGNQRLKGENAGYRDATTAIIPETRFTDAAPAAAWLAAMGIGAAGGARARFGWNKPSRFRRANAFDAAALAVDAISVGGLPKVSAKIRRAGRHYRNVMDNIVYAPSSAINHSTDKKVERMKMAGEARPRIALERVKGRARAALMGAAVPGALLFAPPAAQAASWVGPFFDSVKGGRSIEKLAKVAAMPEAAEALAKAGVTRATMDWARSVAQRILTPRTPAPSRADLKAAYEGAAAPARGAARTAYGGRVAQDYIDRRKAGGFYATLMRGGGAALGAAAGAGAAYGGARLAERVYYRDEEGRFTSKDRAVLTGLGAAAGALAGAAIGGRAVGANARRAAQEAINRFRRPSDLLATARGDDKLAAVVEGRVLASDRKEIARRVGRKPAGDKDAPEVKAYEARRRELTGEMDRLRVGLDANGAEINLADAFSERMRESFKARGLSGRTRADAMEAATAARALAEMSTTRGAMAERKKAAKAAADGMKALRDAVAQGPEAWGMASLREIEGNQIRSLIRQSAAPNNSKSWWNGVPQAADKKKILTGIWERTGSLDQALAAAKLPAAKEAELRAIQASVKASADEFAQRIGGLTTRRTKLTADLEEAKTALREGRLATKAAEEAADEARRALRDAGSDISRQKKAGLERAVTNAESKLLRAREMADDNQSGLLYDRLKQVKAELDAVEEVLRPQRGEIAEITLKDAGLSAQPLPRNPFPATPGKVEYLPAPPTDAALKAMEDERLAREITRINERQIKAAMEVGAERRRLTDEIEGAAASLLSAPPGRMGAAMMALTDRLAPHMAAAKRDLRLAGRDISAYVNSRFGDGPDAMANAARAARDKVTAWTIGTSTTGPDGVQRRTGGVINWVMNHPKKSLALAFASNIGILDYTADGRINGNLKRAREVLADPTLVLDAARANNGAYYRMFNPMDPDPKKRANIYGVTQKLKDGTEIFLEGRIEVDGVIETIPALTPVAAVEQRYRRDANQQNQANANQGNVPRVALRGDLQERLNAANEIVNRNKDAQERIEGAQGDVVSGTDSGKIRDSQDRQKVEKAARDLQDQLRPVAQRAPGQAGDFYAVLGTILNKQGRVLSLDQKLEYLTGSQSVFGQDGRSFGRPKDVGQLKSSIERLVNKAPAPADPQQESLLRRAVALMAAKGGERAITDFGPLNQVVANRRKVGGGTTEKASGAQASDDAPAPPPPPRNEQPKKSGRANWDDAEWIDRSVKYADRQIQRAIEAADEKAGAQLESRRRVLADRFAQIYRVNLDRVSQDRSAGPDDRRRAADDALRAVLLAVRGEGAQNPTEWTQPIEKAAGAMLRKSGFDETKIRRHAKGNDQGGEFAPKGGAQRGAEREAPQREPRGQQPGGAAPRARQGEQPRQDERSYFEPVRLGGTVGGALGGQTAWEVFNRYAPPQFRRGGKIGRFAVGMIGSILGGVAGQMGGEAVARAGYRQVGRAAPDSYERPPGEAGEEASRAAGGIAGSFLGAAARRLPAGIALGAAGSLTGEELAAKAWEVAQHRFGVERR